MTKRDFKLRMELNRRLQKQVLQNKNDINRSVIKVEGPKTAFKLQNGFTCARYNARNIILVTLDARSLPRSFAQPRRNPNLRCRIAAVFPQPL